MTHAKYESREDSVSIHQILVALMNAQFVVVVNIWHNLGWWLSWRVIGNI